MNKITALFESAVLDDEKLYFFCRDINLLGMFNLKTKESSIIGSIPDEDILEKRLCGDIQKWNNYLILIPLRCKKIWIYDISTYKWEKIDISFEVNEYQYFDSKIVGNMLYLIGYWTNHIATLNMITREIKVICRLEDEYKFGYSSVIYNEHLYIAACNQPQIVKISLKTNEIEKIDIKSASEGLYGVDYSDGIFWIITKKSKLIRIKIDEKGKYNEKIICKSPKDAYPRGICTNGKYVICASTQENSSIIIRDNQIAYESDEIWFIRRQKNVIIYATKGGKIYIYSNKNYNIENNVIFIDKKEKDKFINSKLRYKKNMFVYETSLIELNNFIDVLMRKDI